MSISKSLVLGLKDKRGCEIDWCFFGEHNLVNLDRPVAIVEGEATAIEMSKLSPDEIWLATGGRGFLKKMAHRLKNCPKKISLYPDREAYDEWKEVGDQYGWFKSHLSEEWFKEGSIPKGDDIHDYYRLKY